MKQIIIISGLLIILLTQSCIKKVDKIIDSNAKVYKIEDPKEQFFNWDKYTAETSTIPLETTLSSVVGIIHKGIVKNDTIYLLDYKNQNFLRFDIEGNFIGRIGKRGKGPDEFLEIRDFCIKDNIIYTLDYGKINCYGSRDGIFIKSFRIENDHGSNPNNMIVFDVNEYYLWTSNPDVWRKNSGEYYRMRKILNGSVVKEYFKYDYKSSDDPRFYKSIDEGYYLKPIDGEYTIYKLTSDSICASFKLDFGEKILNPEEIEKLRNSNIRNAYLRSNSFKHISDVFETANYIYFRCIGPGSKQYEGLIEKKTGNVEFGRWDFKRSPKFFYADGKYLYGYYEPYTLMKELDDKVFNCCFNSIREKLKGLKVGDNYIIVKVLLN